MIIYLSILGNIDQNQYVEKVRTLMDFIAPRILKEDIETIWKMQVCVDIFKRIKFNSYFFVLAWSFFSCS